MTDDEIAVAKTNVEQALYGWVEPNEADLVAFAEAEEIRVMLIEPSAGDFIAAGESDDNVGKPTLSGA
jgi:hypothetical protein